MEERIIDDEYGRGIRLKKTKDGYVDVTDELAEEVAEAEEVETQVEGEDDEEVVFEFPEIYEDDEELAALMPEQAEELKRKREEERKLKEEEYQALLSKGNESLSAGDFEEAKRRFQAGMDLVRDHDVAAVGYWEAVTEHFTYPDRLAEEYIDYDEESHDYFVMENGIGAKKTIAEKYRAQIEGRLAVLKAEKEPIEDSFFARQDARRGTLMRRKKKTLIGMLSCIIPALILLVVAIVCFIQIPSRPDLVFLYVGIAVSGVAFGLFIAFLVVGNRFFNTRRMLKLNEDLYSTEEGATLADILLKEEFYEKILG